MSDIEKTWGASSKGNLLFFDPDALTIVEDPSHALYDERVNMELDDKKIKNVMLVGVLEPIIVRKNGVREDGTPIVEVVAGRQRVRWAREANKLLEAEGKEKIRVPAVARKGEEKELFGVSVSENEIRQNDDNMTRAYKAKRFMDMGYTLKETALWMGKSDTTVKNLLTLLDCAPETQNAVREGKLSIQAAVKMAALPPEDQKNTVEEIKEEIKEKEKKGSSRKSGGKSTNEKIKTKTSGKTKVRERKVKSIAQVKELKSVLEKKVNKSPDAKLGFAILSWFLGNDEPLKAYRVLFNAAEEV